MKRAFSAIISISILILALSGCKDSLAQSASATAGNETLNIVTTIFPQYDFAREITGGKADIAMLLPPGAESHTYEPAPQDIIAIQNCDLFVYVGGESDGWIESVLDSMGDKAPAVLRLVDCVTVVEEQLSEGMQSGHDHADADADDHKHDHEHKETEFDEHVWTSPSNAIEIVRRMCDVISSLDDANSATYHQNADNYIQDLSLLKNDFAEMVKGSSRNLIIVGDRFPFRYLADEFGLNYYAAFSGCSSDTEASAATVAFLTDKIKAEKIPAVFYMEFSNHKIADSIAEATGAETLLIHSCHNVTKEDFQSAGYLSLMRQNLEMLKKALN